MLISLTRLPKTDPSGAVRRLHPPVHQPWKGRLRPGFGSEVGLVASAPGLFTLAPERAIPELMQSHMQEWEAFLLLHQYGETLIDAPVLATLGVCRCRGGSRAGQPSGYPAIRVV